MIYSLRTSVYLATVLNIALTNHILEDDNSNYYVIYVRIHYRSIGMSENRQQALLVHAGLRTALFYKILFSGGSCWKFHGEKRP